MLIPRISRTSFFTILLRSCRLRCPICGQDKLFRGYFAMHPACRNCGTRYQREPGFFLGSIYFNYGLTGLVVAIGFPLLTYYEVFSAPTRLLAASGFVALFPVWFFRYARSLWLGFDHYLDPRSANKE